MKKKAALLLILSLLLGGCAEKPLDTTQQSVPDEATVQTTAPETSAPDFTVYDAKGNEVKLSDFLGKPVVLNFWASWCGPCKGEMPDFQEAYVEYGKEIQFLMINLTDGSSETVESASAFLESKGYTFPVFFDTTYSAASAYRIRSIPATFFVDAQGNLVTYAIGMIGKSQLQSGIEQIITQ